MSGYRFRRVQIAEKSRDSQDTSGRPSWPAGRRRTIGVEIIVLVLLGKVLLIGGKGRSHREFITVSRLLIVPIEASLISGS